MGVFLYYILMGNYPFEGSSKREIALNITKCDFDRYSSDFVNLSQNVRDLIEECLLVNPAIRSTPSDLLKSTWLEEVIEIEQTFCKNIYKTMINQIV